jgi:hypothetical protein
MHDGRPFPLPSRPKPRDRWHHPRGAEDGPSGGRRVVSGVAGRRQHPEALAPFIRPRPICQIQAPPSDHGGFRPQADGRRRQAGKDHVAPQMGSSAPATGAMSNRSLRKRNRSLHAPAPKFRILKIYRAETGPGNFGLRHERMSTLLRAPDTAGERPRWLAEGAVLIGPTYRSMVTCRGWVESATVSSPWPVAR